MSRVSKISPVLAVVLASCKFSKLVLIPIRLFGFLVCQYSAEILCMLSSLQLCLVACLFLWISAESTASLWSVSYNYLVALMYREWNKAVNPREIMFTITWLILRKGFFGTISKEVITQLDSVYHLTHLFGAFTYIKQFLFPTSLWCKVQDYFSTTKPEVGNENVDSQWKGAAMSLLDLFKAESSMQSSEVHLDYFFRTEIVSPNLTSAYRDPNYLQLWRLV